MIRVDLFLAPAVASAVALAACSAEPERSNASVAHDAAATESRTAPTSTPPAAATNLATPTPELPSPTPASATVIGLKGLGDLRIGKPVPGTGSWAERGAQTGDNCRTVSSPSYPGVYAIVTDGQIRRITVGQRSEVKLAEGIGIGATEKDVRRWFGGFREEPHKYEDSPAKYLTDPNAGSGGPAVRFEFGRDSRVSQIHVGTMPVLGFVESCS